jgi:hypothetical protein
MVTSIYEFNAYGVFCITNVMLANGYKNEDLDIFWNEVNAEYKKFYFSKFNDCNESELDCIKKYFSK